MVIDSNDPLENRQTLVSRARLLARLLILSKLDELSFDIIISPKMTPTNGRPRLFLAGCVVRPCPHFCTKKKLNHLVVGGSASRST